MSPIPFGNVTLTFVEHNKGRNWHAVNFNRECWLMLLGFPPDFREDDCVFNPISSFGRVAHWIHNQANLAKLLIRTRVVDYESVPQFLVLTEAEGFQGESWTVQCEILQGNLLGGLPANEEPVPRPDDFLPGAPLIFFGFGQQGPGPANPTPPPQPIGPNPHNGGVAGGQNQPMDAIEAWEVWPDHNPVVQAINLNEAP